MLLSLLMYDSPHGHSHVYCCGLGVFFYLNLEIIYIILYYIIIKYIFLCHLPTPCYKMITNYLILLCCAFDLRGVYVTCLVLR